MDENGIIKLKASLDEIAQILARKEHYSAENFYYLCVKNQLESILNSELIRTGNHVSGNLCLEWLQDYVSRLLECSRKASSKLDKYTAIEIEAFTQKVSYLARQLTAALNLSHKDLASLPDDHPRVVALRNHTTTVDIISAEVMRVALDKFLVPYNTLKAMIIKIINYKNSYWRKFMAGYYFFYFMAAKKQTKMHQCYFDSHFTKEIALNLWRMLDSKLLATANNFGYPKIYLNKTIYVPRVFPHVLLDETSNPTSTNSMYFEVDDKKGVEIAINHHNPIRGLMPMNIGAENENIETIIVFIHGGGLIGGSTGGVQGVTRGFANATKIPVFSLGYRLAPEFPFPAAVDDVWQAYNWIVNYSYEYFKIKPNKIILSGESAGCNLAVTLTNRLIETNGRVPDSLLLAYPFLSQDTKYFSKTSIIAVEEALLSFPFEELVEASYKSHLDNTHYLLSPVYTPSKNIKRFPKTRIMSPLNDPLVFNGLRFAEKLVSKNKDVHVYEFPNAIHGSLSLGNKSAIPQLTGFYEKTVSILQELIA